MYKRVELSAYVLIITALMIAVMSWCDNHIPLNSRPIIWHHGFWVLLLFCFCLLRQASDCSLSFENGKKYMLGCQEAPEMVEAVKKNI